MKVSFLNPDFARFSPHGNSVELPLNRTANGPERHIVEVVQMSHTCGHLCKFVRMHVTFFLRKSKKSIDPVLLQFLKWGKNDVLARVKLRKYDEDQ